MYYFKEDKKDELLKGKTNVLVADRIGLSPKWLGDIILRRVGTTKLTAYCITKETNCHYEITNCFEFIKKEV